MASVDALRKVLTKWLAKGDDAWERVPGSLTPGLTQDIVDLRELPKVSVPLDDADAIVRVKNLPAILKAGEVQNVFGSGKTAASAPMKQVIPARLGGERLFWGYGDNAPAAERPKYGYFSKGSGERWENMSDSYPDKGAEFSSQAGASQYGPYGLVLKPDMRDRMTYTLGDSLDEVGRGPTPATIPNDNWDVVNEFLNLSAGLNLRSWPRSTAPKVGNPVENPFNEEGLRRYIESMSNPQSYGYIEAQTHGPLKLENIAAVRHYAEPSSSVEKALRKYGIQYEPIPIPEALRPFADRQTLSPREYMEMTGTDRMKTIKDQDAQWPVRLKYARGGLAQASGGGHG